MNQSIAQFSRANRRVVIPRLLFLVAFSVLLIAVTQVSNFAAPSGALSFVISSRIPGSATTGQSSYDPDNLGSVLAEPAAAPVISGTRSICPSGCDYLTITAAIADIQAQGLGGALTLELASTYVSSDETFPLTFTNLTGASSTNTLTVRPASGATNLAISSANTTATINLDNGSFVVIDGRAGGVGTSKELTIENTNLTASAIRFINDANNNTVKYAVLKGVSTNTLRGVVWFSTTTGASGNDNNTIDNCDIRDGATTPAIAVNSFGSTATAAQNNSGNTISNCNIFNFYRQDNTSAGVRLGEGNSGWTITGNSFYQTSVRAASSNSPFGILLDSPSGNNFTITNNFFGGGAANAGGTAWTTTGTTEANRFVGIYLNVGTTTPSNLQGNTIKNFVWTSSSNATGMPGVWTGIYVVGGSVNVGTATGNIIGDGTGTGSISVTTSGNGGTTFGIGLGGNGTRVVSNNTIGSIATNGTTTGVSASLVGLGVALGTNTTISNNTIGSTTTANSLNANTSSISVNAQQVTGILSSSSSVASIEGNTVANLNNNYEGTANAGQVRGIFTQAGANTITGNTVRNLSTTSQNTNTTTSQSVYGIVQTSQSGSQTVSQNVVHSLSNTTTSAAVWVTGIYCLGTFLSTNLTERNLVHSLSLASTSSSSAISGIHVSVGAFWVQNNMVRLGLDASGASTVGASIVRGIADGVNSTNRNFYHNSIYVGGTQTQGAANTVAFLSLGGGNLRTYRNNIFFNARSNTGSASGKHYAVVYGGVGFNPAGLTSNHNIFFMNGVGGVLGFYNAADRTTLSAWQNAHGQDTSSAFVDPLFVNPTAGTPDLHLQANNPAEGSGIANALVTDDFDGEVRSSLTPTDVGADAGNFTLSSDAFGPVINYPLLSSGSTANRTLTGFATITDNLGVSDSPNRPRLYFKKSSDADAFGGNTSADNGWKFVAASNSTSPYDFTIDYSIINGGSVVVGDTIQYFVVAQDAANNLSSNPGGAGSSASPPVQNINVKPGAVNSYNILASVSGTKTVCAAGPPTCDYVNLTGASGVFADINSKIVTGNLTVNITGNLTEDGATGLNQIVSNDLTQPTITIQPADGTLKVISGIVTGGMIRLNGADEVDVDGRFNGAGRFLLFRNTSVANGSPTITLLNDASNNTIRNSIIEGVSNLGVMSLGSGIVTGNDNNLITNNVIRDRSDAVGVPLHLFVSSGSTLNNANSGNSLSNNEMFNFSAAAITMTAPSSGNESWTIRGNTIYQTEARLGSPRGIEFSSTGTNTITENLIRDLNANSGMTGIVLGAAFGTTVSHNRIYLSPRISGSGSALHGIEVLTGGAGSRSVTLVNNQITITTSLTHNVTIRGIYDNGGTGSTFNAYHNTVLVSGADTGFVSSWACLRGASPSSIHTSRNNICFNNRSGGTGDHFAAGSLSSSGSFSSDFNLFVGTGSVPANFMGLGTFFQTTPVSFATWQSSTGGDANSQAGNPGGNFTTAMFVNPAVGDLHIVAAGNPLVSNTGTPVAGVATDYDNETRDATTPDIGSDEINPIPPDTTVPNVLFIDDGDADNAVFTNAAITYAIAFNEDIDAATLTAADFDNIGTSTISIGTITETSAQSGVFNVQVTPTSPGTVILRVRSDNVIADPAGNSLANPVTDDSTITVSNAADVQINSLTDSPDPVFDDELITYNIGFINNGPSNASSATVTNAIPANTTFFSASTSSPGWSRTDVTPVGGTGNIVFSNPSAPVGGAASFTLVVKVNPGTSTGTFITNTATAASSTLDPVPGNNSLSTFTSVVQSLALIVNDAGDVPDNNIGNSICDTSAAPGEQCTLRAAIQESNTTIDFDTIGFAPALSGSTILLNNALDPITSNLSINGPGANLLTVKRSESAAARFRIFTINAFRTVSISGLTVTNGSTAGGTDAPAGGMAGEDGGGILNLGTLTLTGVVITGNRTGNGGNATNPGFTLGGPGGDGGGISSSGSLTMTKVTVSNNLTGNGGNAGHGGHGGLGGGVHVSGTMTMTSSSVTGNNTGIGGVGSQAGASGGSGGLGGGMYVEANGTFTMTQITVTGNNTGDGGGISGTGGHGGGIAYDSFVLPTGSASLINSTVNNNTTGDASPGVWGQAGFGGGIFSVGTLTIIGSAINGNSTGFNGPGGGGVGGGIDNSGTLTMTNTTVSGNSTGAEGGTGAGLWNARTATLTNCTIVFNSSFATFGGAGIHHFSSFSVVNISNTIVAGNSLNGSPNGPDVDSSFAYNSQGNNLIGNGEGSSGFTQPGDQVGTGSSPLNPGLGPLANNGGPTMTHAVLLNSPVIDKGDDAHAIAAGLTTDQRGAGFPRFLDGDGDGTSTVDIGAFEAETSVLRPDLIIRKSHTGNFAQGQIGASYTITVSNSDRGPTNGSAVTVIDSVPVGLTPTGPIGAHNGWTCSIMGQTLTCTRNDVLAGNSSYPDITLTVNVANPAPVNVTNMATVSGGGEVNTSNNTASDPTSINCAQDFSLNNASPLMISRFRMNGPAGPQDEFVEIFNPSTTAHTVASGNCAGGGYGVYASSGNGTTSNAAPLVCYIPNGTVIPAGGYYLCTGATYSLSNLGRNGGAAGATSIGDAPIGCNGLCSPGIPDDAGLALMNVAQGISLTPEGGFLGGVPDAGFILYDKVGFGPYGAGAPSPNYPSMAGNFCEGTACLQPVGDAGNGGACDNPTGLFPVVAAPGGACYGEAGQYQFLRRQTAFNPALGTVHIDTNNSANDFILVSPNPGFSMGLAVTGVGGVTAILGSAAPQGSIAPPDTPSVSLKQGPFDSGTTQFGAPNAERNYGLDPTVLDPANNPGGTFALRLRFTNNSASNIGGLRFRIDQISTLCGAQTESSTVGSGSARNLSSSPDCGTGSLTAILKLLNSAQEVVIDSTSTAHAVNGTVIEDLSASATPTPPGAGPLSPGGSGLDSSFIVNPSSDLASIGDGVSGGTGVFATAISTTDPNKVLRIKIKFGVVRSGRFILLITPATKPAP